MSSGGLVTRVRRGDAKYDLQSEVVHDTLVTQVFKDGVVIHTIRTELTDTEGGLTQCRIQHARVHMACESGTLFEDDSVH